MIQTYAYGHDFGNAETCGVLYSRDRKVSRSVPSVTTHGKLSELANLGIALEETDYVYKDDLSELFVGSLALAQSKSPSITSGDTSRYWSRKSLQLLLTVASSLIPDQEFALNVVTGLPVRTYVDEPEARKRVRDALEGVHSFSINGVKRVISVKVERVIMEGAGALVAYGLKEKHRQGVIDIGGHTTDLFAATGQIPLRDYCTGKQLGVETAALALNRDFQGRYGRELSAHEIYAVLYAYAGENSYPVIHARRGQVTDLKDMVERAVRDVGSDIASWIATTWNEAQTSQDVASSFARVLLVGGGAYYFHKDIERTIPNVKVAQLPHEANALGYAAFADGQLQRTIRIA